MDALALTHGRHRRRRARRVLIEAAVRRRFADGREKRPRFDERRRRHQDPGHAVAPGTEGRRHGRCGRGRRTAHGGHPDQGVLVAGVAQELDVGAAALRLLLFVDADSVVA